MSRIWTFMLIASIIFLLFLSPAKTVMLMMGASKDSIEMCLEFLGIYAVWLGILQILDDTNLSHGLSNLLAKPIDKIFGKTNSEVRKNISLNISSNILGLGSAATPFGLKAMQGMDDKTGIATTSMIMLVVINSTGIQILPTTVIGLRAMAGSTSPSSILLPTIIATFVPTVLGILLVKMKYGKRKMEKIKLKIEKKNYQKQQILMQKQQKKSQKTLTYEKNLQSNNKILSDNIAMQKNNIANKTKNDTLNISANRKYNSSTFISYKSNLAYSTIESSKKETK